MDCGNDRIRSSASPMRAFPASMERNSDMSNDVMLEDGLSEAYGEVGLSNLGSMVEDSSGLVKSS